MTDGHVLTRGEFQTWCIKSHAFHVRWIGSVSEDISDYCMACNGLVLKGTPAAVIFTGRGGGQGRWMHGDCWKEIGWKDLKKTGDMATIQELHRKLGMTCQKPDITFKTDDLLQFIDEIVDWHEIDINLDSNGTLSFTRHVRRNGDDDYDTFEIKGTPGNE